MKRTILPAILGTVLVLGLPPLLVVTGGLTSEPSSSAAPTSDPFQALLAKQSTLEPFYQAWQQRYIASGGDANVLVTLAWTEGLSTERSSVRGQVELDMLSGTARARVEGQSGQPVDLWLVDNQDGPGRTVAPELGDRMVRIGRLGGDSATVAQLGREFFRTFELDLAVVSRAGATPVESRLLLGTRPFFERLYTTTRLKAERASNATGLRGFLSPSSLGTMLAPRDAEANSVLVSHGLVSQAVSGGADLFFRGTFGGNSRTCGTCHRVNNNQGLDLDFIQGLPANDPLFVAEFPPSQGGVPGLERPALMRNHALILENADGFASPTTKFTMRGVPHSLSMATSLLAPADGRAAVQRTGWSGDGAPNTGALRFFPVGAVTQHFTKSLNRVSGVDFVLPTDAQLDQMEAFTLASGRLNELNLATVTLRDSGAQAGKLRFMAADARCNFCHANAGANVANGENQNFDTGVERAPDPSQATESHPQDGGFGPADRDCDGNGPNDCFGDGTFNTTPLIEAADTEPFFHNNSAATIEDAVAFYTTQAFAQSPAGIAGGGAIPLTATDIVNIGKFLRVLNAAFNASLAIQRNKAALTLQNSTSTDPNKAATINMLISLSNAEIVDGIEVLEAAGLQAGSFRGALQQNVVGDYQGAINSLEFFKSAMTRGGNVNFTLGEGNLLF